MNGSSRKGVATIFVRLGRPVGDGLSLGLRLWFWLYLGAGLTVGVRADEPPALNPFGARESRADAIPGYCELSDGRRVVGRIYLTRDHRLKIFDPKMERQREVPLNVVQRIECVIDKEWLEKEWRFKENANDQKVFTGKSYPARECHYQITLKDGRTIAGPLSTVVYVDPTEGGKTERFLLNKRQKGEVGEELKQLVYVKTIVLGDAAMAEAASQTTPARAPQSSTKSPRR